ncbi:MAG: retroviral-like aspartic protease family protein [Plectolyngbya sp. WJT66-NPBG17]|jgi:predicted aspartyl protease|nr:retroviral-like aspartic protease family protein [Plectolyngbya sp. WJT66-NPBG17]MBW4527000.1 retroviral-like aspartic protease family protein [Phormidium tanganyikae FI6-MK23]
MLRFGVRVILPLLMATSAAIGVGCSRRESMPSKSPQVSTPVVRVIPSPTAKSIEDSYQSALDRAASARAISQSAQSPEDWQLVASRWKNAIAALKQVPKSDPNRKFVNQKLSEFNQALTNAEDRAAKTGKEKVAAQDPGIRVDRAMSADEVASITTQKERGFQVPIKYRKNRIPVIDVTFNGSQRFEMMVDTGASATMITQGMARQLGARVVGETQAMTAAGVTTVQIAVVQSISVAGSTIREVPVSIGPLDVGLLGHDFFGDCDISIGRDFVEFRQCNVL